MKRMALVSSIALSLVLASGPAGAIDPKAASAASSDSVATAATDNGGKRGFLGGIFGCQADGNKQTIGTIAGGVLGGFLGNRIAGRGSRTLGTILGGALGAAAGSAVGCKLQKNDQAKAERAVEEAAATGKDQTWSSDETGASGTVKVAGAEGGALSGIKLASGVEPASGYAKVASAFIASGNANVRSRPGTDGKIVGTLASGTRVWVPASVSGQPWYLISDAGIGQGYVSNALLKKVTNDMASGCRVVKQTISQPGAAAESETLQACKDKDGQWVMTRV